MAQYYQVLSQTEKSTTEELREYYPSIIDNSSQSVQYIIRPNEQAFQGSPLMVLDTPTQQLIVDQSQVTFQNQQYILQDTNIDFREGQTQQRIFYMEDSGTQQIDSVQGDQVPQTIVLNHQLPGAQILGQISNNTTPKIVMSLQRQTPINPLPQPLKQEHTIMPQRQVVTQPRLPAALIQNRAITIQKAGISQNTPRLSTPVKARRPIAESATSSLHYQPQPQRPEEVNEKNLLRYKAAPEKKTPVNTTTSQSTNQPANAEFELTLTTQTPRGGVTTPQTPRGGVTTPQTPRGRVTTPQTTRGGAKKRSNKSSSPRQNNRNSKSKAAAASCQNSTSENQSQQQVRTAAPRPPRPSIRSNLPQQTPATRMPQPPPPPPQVNMQPIQQQAQQVQNAQYVIQPHQQQQQTLALPSYVPSNQIKKIIESTPLTEEYTDSIRMLVLLSTGEQRLITFTLPKEQCTIQEILEQVGVQIEPETKIECNETNMNGINYIVTVTMPQHLPRNLTMDEPMELEDNSFQGTSATSVVQSQASPIPEPPKPPTPPTPEPPKELPKYKQGMLAVCSHCGYLSEDFNKCLRCKRKLPEDVRAITTGEQPTVKKIDNKTISVLETVKPTPPVPTKTNGTAKSGAGPRKKTKPRLMEQEPIILTLSSDDEEEDTNTKPNVAPLKIIETALMPEIKKEPSIIDIQECDKELVCDKTIQKEDITSQQLSTSINCRTIRIGSYRFVPCEDVIVNSTQVIIQVPLPNEMKEIRTVTIDKTKIVKVLANFQKVLPVIFYYVMPSCGIQIREQLNMTAGSDYYFDPVSSEEAFKRITILPEHFNEDTKMIFKQIYSKPFNMMDELTAKEANNILLRTCPKEVTKAIGVASCFTEIKQLLIYPPGKGGLSINTEDYICLAQDQFLNDVIIDFYLKYTVLNLPQEKRDKVHVFSTFFYKRLTTKPLKASRRSHPSELDSSLTPAQKRHARVKNWTKNVNLFEKDFIIVPINESCHWFLAIICFPGMDGCYTFDGKPVKLETKQNRKKIAGLANVTITKVKVEKSEPLPCDDGEASDKDEAEGDDSELESEDDQEEVVVNSHTTPIKQPCILIFDSLAGASRSRVVATLREYLTCEYRIKMNTEKIFNKDTIKCACAKVPQQTNFTDCGLYLLQYAESFFTDPIDNYHLPMHQLKNWFEEITVTRKREDISKLIKQLMLKYNKDPNILPDIIFPTLNGKLLPRIDDEEEEEEDDEFEEEEEDDDEMEDEDHNAIAVLPHNDSEEAIRDSETGEHEASPDIEDDSCDGSIQPSHESVSHNDNMNEQKITLIKPDVSEVKKRDTLSYLKAKRIIRHKSSECSDSKKFKSSESI